MSGLRSSDDVDMPMEGDAIAPRPRKLIEVSRTWSWDSRWQEGEREASSDIAQGRSRQFDSDEAFLESLEWP